MDEVFVATNQTSKHFLSCGLAPDRLLFIIVRDTEVPDRDTTLH
jgi:hypothetical protein